MTSKENKVATVLIVVGVLSITVGVISGLYHGSQDEFAEFGESQTRIAWGMVINGAVWGIVFIGFAEIIKLLQGIFNQREPELPMAAGAVPPESSLPVVEKEAKQQEIPESVKFQIEDFYTAKGRTVEKIVLTEKEDYFLVTVDGNKELVELGGFKPVIHPFET
ncbi:hypothetical protein [Bacillus sp. AK031]